MAVEAGSSELLPMVMLLGAAVVAVPLFKRFGLGSVLGYLAAGLAIGPFGLGWFSHPQTIVHTAELGVVMFLFVIGLEMQPSHLWALRRAIFGLGSLQVLVCGSLLTLLGMAFGFDWRVAFVGAMGFVLTSTAVVMQLLGERGDIASPRGQKIVSILLFEDLLIVPLLAVVAFISPDGAADMVGGSRWTAIGVAAGSVALLVAVGVWLLNPLFQVLARAHAREVMTAAALLVVLGAALLMQLGGLSMAMGAFLAGVLLSESTFRHQLEADIEPFRGLLLGLFFLGVGMSLDLAAVASHWVVILAGVVLLMAVKALGIYLVARLLHARHEDAMDRAVLMAQGGEFAFVLFAAALGARVIDPVVNANLTAIVVLSMALTPLVVMWRQRRLAARAQPATPQATPWPDHKSGGALVIGFGRVGQIASQNLLLQGIELTIIDADPQLAREAERFGFKVYYGDGTRLDILRAAGAQQARVILVCVDQPSAATQIVQQCKRAFPGVRVIARAFDREHAAELIKAGVDLQVRETFEGAMLMGREGLLAMGIEPQAVDAVVADMRVRDANRLQMELEGGGLVAGRPMILGNLRGREGREARDARGAR